MSHPQPPLSALNFRIKRPQHSWSQEERYLLCCLRRFFNLQWPQITKIFNQIYAVKIQAEGFHLPEGLKKSTITIQWVDLARRFHDDWKYVHHDIPFEQGQTHFDYLFQMIATASAALHIGLVPRARDLDVSQFGLMATTRRRAQPAQPAQHIQPVPATFRQATQAVPTESQNSSALRPLENNPVRENPPEPTQAAPPPQSIQNAEIFDPIEHIRSYGLNRRDEFPKPTPAAQVPSLLWRFSNDDSAGINSKAGYVAYAFTVDLGNIPSPEERLEEFPAWVWSHVNKKRIPSPFISTSVDPLVPMHRALRANRNAIFSLVNPGQIAKNHVFWMRDLMRQYSIFTRGYYGTKEYIIWGCISRNAILMSFRVDEVLEITGNHADIKEMLQLDVISESRTCKTPLFDRLAAKTFESDFQVGKTLGKMLKLLHLQHEYAHDAAIAFNKSWRFTESEDTTQFLLGVDSGYDQTAEPQSDPCSSPSSSNRSSDVESMNSSDLIPQEDFVLVESSQRSRNEHEEEREKVRESIDRLSILDDEDDGGVVIVSNTPCQPPQKDKEVVRSTEKRSATMQFPVESKFRKTEDGVSFSSRNRPVATRHISMFNPNSASWSPIQDSDTKAISVKEEEILPSIEGVENHEVRAPEPQTTPPRIKRSSSIGSDSTIGNDTPTIDRFGRERSHINRVINTHLPAFWDSLQESAND